VTETVGRDFAARLHRVAVGFVLPVGPNVNDAVVLAEDLLASDFSGPATVEVAALQRGAIRSDAEHSVMGWPKSVGPYARHPARSSRSRDDPRCAARN